MLEDVVGGLLGRSTGVGGLEITSPEPRLVVTSRTYNQSTSGTYGQGIPGFPLASALTAEASGEIAGLVETDAYRTNLGFLNASPSTVSVRADFRDDAGALLGTKSWTLAPYSQTQSNQVLKGVSTSPVPGARATISLQGGGAVFAYASVVDNRTGDPVFLPAVVPGS